MKVYFTISRVMTDGNLFKTTESFLDNKHQRVALNGHSSDWKLFTAGVQQGSVLSRLFFLIYINDLPQSLTSDVKLLADNISLFSVVNNSSVSASDMNIVKIQDWTCKWKM